MLVGLQVGVGGRVSLVIARQRGAGRFCFRGRLAAATIVSFGSTFCRSGEEEEMETHGDKLLEQAKGGDQEALLALLKQHGPFVRQSLVGKIPQRYRPALTEDDIMQQTYADAVANIEGFYSAKAAAFSIWLKTIAQNNLRDALKMLDSEKHGGTWERVEPTGDESFLTLWENLSAAAQTPCQHVSAAEAKTALQQAIAQLPEDYARVIQMYDIEGRSIEEVCEALGRRPGAVYMLRARALHRLHKIMGRTSKYFSA